MPPIMGVLPLVVSLLGDGVLPRDAARTESRAGSSSPPRKYVSAACEIAPCVRHSVFGAEYKVQNADFVHVFCTRRYGGTKSENSVLPCTENAVLTCKNADLVPPRRDTMHSETVGKRSLYSRAGGGGGMGLDGPVHGAPWLQIRPAPHAIGAWSRLAQFRARRTLSRASGLPTPRARKK